MSSYFPSYWDRFLNYFRPNQTKTSGAVGFNELAYQANLMTVERLRQIIAQAEIGSVDMLLALYRDIFSGHSHLQAEFNTRKLAVLGDPLSFVPRDKNRPEDVLAAKACERLKECPTWNLGRNHLLNAALYPVALVEKIYKPAEPNELGIRWDLAELCPVKYHALTYQWRASLRLWDFDPDTGLRMASTYIPEPEQFIIHRGHLLTQMPDYWGGPMRAVLFWWLFSVMDRDWWVRFLSRFGTPFIVGKYNSANQKDKNTLTAAFSAASQLLGLVISKDTEVEIQEISADKNGDAFLKMHDVANREMSKLILGQTMTSEAQNGGMGSNQAKVHNMVRGDIKQFDSTTLATTLENQLIKQYLAFNGLTGSVKIICGSAGPEEVTAAATVIKTAHDAGLQLTQAGIEQFSELSGLPFERAAVNPAPPAGLSALEARLLYREPFEALYGRRAQISGLSATTPRQSRQLPAYLPPDAVLDSIASSGAEGLAAAFTGLYAPVRRMILESESASDLEHRLRTFYADHSPAAAAELIEQALTAHAANGTLATRKP